MAIGRRITPPAAHVGGLAVPSKATLDYAHRSLSLVLLVALAAAVVVVVRRDRRRAIDALLAVAR